MRGVYHRKTREILQKCKPPFFAGQQRPCQWLISRAFVLAEFEVGTENEVRPKGLEPLTLSFERLALAV